MKARVSELSLDDVRRREELAVFLLRCSPEDFAKMAALMTNGSMSGLQAFEAVWREKLDLT